MSVINPRMRRRYRQPMLSAREHVGEVGLQEKLDISGQAIYVMVLM